MKNRLFLLGQKWIERGAWFLAPVSWLWAFISFSKNFFYDHGWLQISQVGCPVVSVGNLVAGGTGKTPLVHLLASQFAHRRVAILSRGYGEIPDEALLLKRRLPDVRMYLGKNRILSARQAVRDGAELIILDDGFQYRKLHRDFNLVVLSGADPFGKGHYLPWGFLRDSPRRLNQADMIFVSGEPPRLPFNYVSLEIGVDRLLDLDGNFAPSVKGWDVAIFSGIGKPFLFKKTVKGLGVNVIAEWILADHEQARKELLCAFVEEMQKKGAKAIFCTEKDFVKLDSSIRYRLPVYFLEISFRPVSGDWEKLIAKINRKIDNFKYGT